MNILYYVTVPTIAATVYGMLALLKIITSDSEKLHKFLPLIAAGLGIILGLVMFFVLPELVSTENVFVAVFIGGASGLAATGSHQIFKQLGRRDKDNNESENNCSEEDSTEVTHG